MLIVGFGDPDGMLAGCVYESERQKNIFKGGWLNMVTYHAVLAASTRIWCRNFRLISPLTFSCEHLFCCHHGIEQAFLAGFTGFEMILIGPRGLEVAVACRAFVAS